MRINKYLAASTGLSRRAADAAIQEGRVLLNAQPPQPGADVQGSDVVTIDGERVRPANAKTTILFYKPVGYVVSRAGQGNRTVYDLLPPQYQDLKPVGRLDKNSSGLLLLTDDGALIQDLTHPSKEKAKVYTVMLDKPLEPLHRQMISDHGITLDDGVSKLELERIKDGDDSGWRVRMHEGRNRQIRRTFNALGYEVKTLHRTSFGPYNLNNLRPGAYAPL